MYGYAPDGRSINIGMISEALDLDSTRVEDDAEDDVAEDVGGKRLRR